MKLTVETHAKHIVKSGEFISVAVNGVDVTRRCQEADDEAGTARCIAVDADGRQVAGYEYLSGDVRFIRRPATEEEIDRASSYLAHLSGQTEAD